jgi:hypothetical protein
MRSTWLLVLALVLLAPAAWGQSAQQASAVARLQQNWSQYESAQARLAELEAAYSRGMTSRDLIGAPRESLVSEIADTKQEIASAREAHDGLFEDARRSGASWSVLDRYEELPAPPASPRPALEESPDDLTASSRNLDEVDDAESQDPDALEGDSENLDDAPEDDGENLDDVDDASSEDSDDLRATSRDP